MSSGPDSVVPNGSAPSPTGRTVGRYELLHEIATGGMATVYLGRARGAGGFERVVAVKCCHPHLRSDEDFAAMFLDEARLAARIHHPNVVGTLDLGDDEALFLVMEYIEGDRLSGLIKAASRRSQRLPMPVALRIMEEILSGLHAAHELTDAQGAALQIVHRDVSPQNILVGIDGVSRITDFGIAKAQARVTVTRDGQIKGKMSYMAPEQMAQGATVTRRADVYSAGVVLWEALTGRRLFRAESEAETLNLVLHGLVPRPSSVAAEIPPELDALVLKSLERDPDKRYATAAEFAEAIENSSSKVATTRAVAACIHDLLGEAIAKRRDLVRRIDEGGPLPAPDRVDISHSAVRVTATTASGVSHSVHAAVATPEAGALPPPDPPVVGPPADESPDASLILPVPWPAGRYVLLAALVLLLVGGGFVALRGHDAAPVAPVRPPQPVSLRTLAESGLVPIAHNAPAAAPPVAVPPVPVAVQASAPSGEGSPPAVGSPRRRGHGHGTASGGVPAPAAAPAPRAAPAPGEGPGEFRPGTI